MRIYFSLLLIGLSLLANPSYSNDLEEVTDAFLQKHVKEGSVDYKGIVANSTELQQLIQLYGIQSLNDYSEEETKAFYINAYNIAVIYHIANNYPIISPQEVTGFFDSKKFQIAGINLTLNQIEKQKLNPAKDPRLHFVLVCGAVSCPVLEPFAYQAEKLEEQIEQQTRKAINDPLFIRVNDEEKKVELSKIFSWYKTDFKNQSENALEFINLYRNKLIPSDYKVGFYDYDWTINSMNLPVVGETAIGKDNLSNLQLFTPSALFDWGQYEVNVFNSMYIQSAIRDDEGKRVDLNESQSFLNSQLQFTTGVSKSARFNIGIDVNITTARYGKKGESIHNFFNEETTTFRKTIISSIGPRIKLIPIRSIPRLSLQSTFLFPIANNQEATENRGVTKFIAHDRYTWFTQLFYDQSIGELFQIFLEADLLQRINRNSLSSGNFFRTPLSAFFSYFPTAKSTLYVFSQYSPRYQTNKNSEGMSSGIGFAQSFTQAGIGAKYQLSNKLGMEIYYANFVQSRSEGAGYSLNIGLRYIYR